jgi:6-phosphogluconate dehydrogenase (decarboxylating)
MEKQSKEQDFNKVESYIEHTGEVNWLVQDAINKEIAIPVIAQSIMELFSSNKRSLCI